MSRSITDNPGGWSRSLPGHTVEYEASFAQPFYYGSSVVINSNDTGLYTLSIVDDTHIFFIDMVNVTPTKYKEFWVAVWINDINYVAVSTIGYAIIPLRMNPSIQLIAGDHVDITIGNLDVIQQTFLVRINGTKIVRPSGFGHAPGAYFTVDDVSISPGGHVHFTDATTNSPVSWEWDFGDGTAHSTEQNPVHVYAVAGTYYPKLVAKNVYGQDNYASSVAIVVT